MKNPVIRILILALLFVAFMSLLSGCVDGKLVVPGTLKARVCYVNAQGQRVCLKSNGQEVELEGDITGTRDLGDGKATIEFGTNP